jgi:Right handed beta helix region
MRRTLLVALALASLAATGCAKGMTGPPRFIGATDAIVEGSFVTNTGGRVVHWVEYGTTQAYGFEADRVATELDPGQFTGSVQAKFTGLQRDTVYHYRICASDSDQQGGPGCGEDRTLRTQQAGCGDTLTTDIRLTGDITCNGGPLYRIGAAGVDINLAGHGASGVLSPFSGPSGIVNDGGYDDVTVRNGWLSGFNPAFHATGADRNRILHVDAGSQNSGVTFTGGADNEIRHSTLAGTVNGGLSTTGTQRLVVADSDISSVLGSAAAYVNGDGARIVRNRFEAVPFSVPYDAVALWITGTGARVADNQVTGKWNGGFFVLGADHVVVDNQLTGVEGDGIFVDPFSTNVRLARNAVDGAADDGFDIQATGVRLGENSATNNGDWGIDAVPGVTDLGGNTASGNGQAAQCRNIVCG